MVFGETGGSMSFWLSYPTSPSRNDSRLSVEQLDLPPPDLITSFPNREVPVFTSPYTCYGLFCSAFLCFSSMSGRMEDKQGQQRPVLCEGST